MTLNSVVLPAPLGPITAEISPGSTRSVTPPRAWNPPNDRETSVTSSSDGAVIAGPRSVEAIATSSAAADVARLRMRRMTPPGNT
jgi:hypothetical protein